MSHWKPGMLQHASAPGLNLPENVQWGTCCSMRQQGSDAMQGELLSRSSSLRESAGPTLKAAGNAVLKSMTSMRKQAENALSGPQVSSCSWAFTSSAQSACELY